MLRRNAGTLSMKADIREETSDETGLREHIRRQTMASEGWYRKDGGAQR